MPDPELNDSDRTLVWFNRMYQQAEALGMGQTSLQEDFQLAVVHLLTDISGHLEQIEKRLLQIARGGTNE